MKLSLVSKLLIQHLESVVLDGRYENLKIMNVDIASEEKRG